jgi:hypothetical protein
LAPTSLKEDTACPIHIHYLKFRSLPSIKHKISVTHLNNITISLISTKKKLHLRLKTGLLRWFKDGKERKGATVCSEKRMKSDKTLSTCCMLTKARDYKKYDHRDKSAKRSNS